MRIRLRHCCLRQKAVAMVGKETQSGAFSRHGTVASCPRTRYQHQRPLEFPRCRRPHRRQYSRPLCLRPAANRHGTTSIAAVMIVLLIMATRLSRRISHHTCISQAKVVAVTAAIEELRRLHDANTDGDALIRGRAQSCTCCGISWKEQ